MADLSADPEILHFRPYVSHMDEKGYSEDQPFLDAMPDFVRVTNLTRLATNMMLDLEPKKTRALRREFATVGALIAEEFLLAVLERTKEELDDVPLEEITSKETTSRPKRKRADRVSPETTFRQKRRRIDGDSEEIDEISVASEESSEEEDEEEELKVEMKRVVAPETPAVMKDELQEEGIWRCHNKKCRKRFTRRSHYLYHYQRRHARATEFGCPDCLEKFNRNGVNQFMYHIDCHEKLRCFSCFNVISPEEEGQEEHSCSPWPCEYGDCGHLYPKRSLLVQHFQHRHAGLSKFLCPDCGFRSSEFRDFVRHVDAHDGVDLCEACGNVQDTFAHIVQCSSHEINY